MEHIFKQPKVLIARRIEIDKQVTTDMNDGEVPEEIMAFAEQVMGNGQARVAVNADFCMKDFGNGTSASVTISLACNQDDETIGKVFNTLKGWTQQMARAHFYEMDAQFKTMIAAKQQSGYGS